jgi:hypothetical protein
LSGLLSPTPYSNAFDYCTLHHYLGLNDCERAAQYPTSFRIFWGAIIIDRPITISVLRAAKVAN